jgi:hypothetical protein
MTEITVPTAPIKRSKKQIRKTIQEKLTVTLADYRNILGEKKFDSRIRKTARLLGSDIVKALPKKPKKEKKTVSQ